MVGPTLDDRYLLESGRLYLSGIQALVRLPFDQARRDRASGVRAGFFISGYPGSPLGSYDLTLSAARRLARDFELVHQPGQNEELAAGAVMGTQMLENYPHERYDGVVGFWYGKGPGMDRSGDAFRHGNYMGTSTHGAVVVLSGEDHEAKSSTLPIQQEYAFVHCGIPVLYPASVGEFIEFGLHAIAMSRYSGCWIGMKLVGQLCDSSQTVTVTPDAPTITLPDLEIEGRPFQKRQYFRFFPGETLEYERLLYSQRHRAAVAYAAANRLNQVVVSSPSDRIGLVAAGKSFADLRQSLSDMGIEDAMLRAAGVRLIKVGLLYPFDETFAHLATSGLEQVVVIEEKRGFLEERMVAALATAPAAPRVVGKRDDTGAELFPEWGALDADALTMRLGPRLERIMPNGLGIRRRMDVIRAVEDRVPEVLPKRTPNYCSGCPHNFSTKLLEGQVAWGAPGCHVFATIIEQPQRHIDVITQYGGEGLPWIGLAPFTDRPHIIQNQGDGSLFHSSLQNIRFSVAAGVNMTYKILYNGSIANTGAQVPIGQQDVPRLAQTLALDGITKMAIIARDPMDYRGASLPNVAKVHGADEFEEVMRDLEATPGVTVMLYDGECANERRRKQKRKLAPRATRYVMINEDVCENCGHCGELTNCMSLHKVDTAFGPKTQVHQSSCNQDHSCLGGDCPSFIAVDVKAGTGLRQRRPPELAATDIPEPKLPARPGPYHVYIPGVGGTGVITVNALLGWAALLDGSEAIAYDQTGAAQKWGAVLSSLVIGPPGIALASSKVGIGATDLYLAFDLMSGANRTNLDRCGPDKTAAVMNLTLLPDGKMIRDVDSAVSIEPLVAEIEKQTDASRTVKVDARRLAESLFADYMTANMFAVGVAYQAGLLPISSASVEQAVAINGVAVEQNLQAFRYGRLAQHDPERVESIASQSLVPTNPAIPTIDPMSEAMVADCDNLDPETRKMLGMRVSELAKYQSTGYSQSYLDFVRVAAQRERDALGIDCSHAVTRAIVLNLYKLMAYKDEYEVARLHLRAGMTGRAAATFEAPAKVKYLLHPPLFRTLGLKRKLELGAWFTPALVALRSLRPLRGTWLDPFGFTKLRREERRLPGWYRELVQGAMVKLSTDTVDVVLAVAQLPDLIRGYEEIKLGNIEKARRRAEMLLKMLERKGEGPRVLST